jgi:hypothetical protein
VELVVKIGAACQNQGCGIVCRRQLEYQEQQWRITVETDSNGMIRTRKTAMSNICETMTSNLTKLRNASFTITKSRVTTDVSMTCILSMEELTAAEDSDWCSKDKGNGLARIFTGWELKPKKKRKS